MSTSRPPILPRKRAFPRLIPLTVLLGLALVTGCTSPQVSSLAMIRPEDMALQKHGAGTTIIGARTFGDTSLVLSTGSPGQQSSAGEVYVDLVTRSGINWNIPLSFSAEGTFTVPQSAMLCYATAETFDQQNGTGFVYGYVRLPDVQSVEIDFTSGQTLQDRSGDGMFAVAHPAHDSSTALRALDGNGAVLHTVAMPTPRATMPPPRGKRGSSGSSGGSVSSFICTP